MMTHRIGRILGGLLLPALLLGSTPSPFLWRADPRKGRLEIRTVLGGWAEAGPAELRVRWVDPTDPRPPQDRSLDYGERWEARQAAEKAALRAQAWRRFRGQPGIAKARQEALILWNEEWGSEAVEDPSGSRELSFLRRWGKALSRARRDLQAAEKSRERPVQAWFNGEALTWELEVNRDCTFSVRTLQGENRLELLDPDTGQRLVRTWWCGSRAPRLRVSAQAPGRRWPVWDLEVLEPGGRLASGLQEFEKTHPSPGTYTLRWNAHAPSSWWSPEEASPHVVRVDVTLDAGTDRERRWRFEKLILPGSGTILLGSFDVES